MAADFPTSIKSFTPETDDVTDALAADINAIYDEVEALETFLGTTAVPALKLDNLAEPDDNTDLDVNTSRHGLCPKGDNDTTHFLNGTGDWSEPVAPDISVGAGAMWPSTTNGCGFAERIEFTTNDVDIYFLPFDKDSDEFAQFSVDAMPSDWDGGTITAKFLWSCASGVGDTAETVCWTIQGICFGDGSDYDAAWGTAQSVTDTWQGDDKHHISGATPAITLAGTPAAGKKAHFRVGRDISEDDLGGDARLEGVQLTFSRA